MQLAPCEPLLDDVFDDPIVKILMEKDSVKETQLRDVITDLRERLDLPFREYPRNPLPAE